MVGLFNCQLAARHLGNSRRVLRRKDANHKGHVRAWLFDMLDERVVIVVDGMLVNYSVVMPVSDDVTVTLTMKVAENKA